MKLNRAIVVVDGRTCRGALQMIQALMGRGDYTKAKSGAAAARIWLRYELGCGPLWRRIPILAQLEQCRRVRYTSYLEQVELLEEQVNEELGLTVQP